MNGSKRGFFLAATLLLVTGLLACSTVAVSTDYDSTANFGQYKTFGFIPMAKINSITAGRIESAITRALQGRGLQKASGTGDLQVSVQARRSHEKVITSTGYGWGRGWRGGMGVTTVQNVPVGTLIVDLVDASANKLVWRGMATDTIDRSSTGREKQEALDSAMAKLFAGYPPAPGQ